MEGTIERRGTTEIVFGGLQDVKYKCCSGDGRNLDFGSCGLNQHSEKVSTGRHCCLTDSHIHAFEVSFQSTETVV